MVSVTQRIDTIKQPEGGYVPKSLFTLEEYLDDNTINEVESAFTSIQGMAVDYMTRFILTKNKEESFLIAIMGAKKVDEAFENNKEITHIKDLLGKVKGLDDDSIYAACQICGYDTAFRAGVRRFKDVDSINPTKDLIENIRIMVERTITFLKKYGPVTKYGFTFEGGYTTLVKSGDGDYLTEKMLIDLKVSKEDFASKWSLQILMYYIMGIHSVYPEFNSIETLCIYNPLKNICYTVNVSDIPDKSKYVVSSSVIGYKMKKSFYVPFKDREGNDKPKFDYSSWRETNGSDEMATLRFLSESAFTDFDINTYKDGIYEISVQDYWTHLKKTDTDYKTVLRPKFDKTKNVVMIKKNGYTMFLSRSDSGNLCILDGGHIKKATHTPEYYYNNLENYGLAVVNKFSKYWEALNSISSQIKALTPSEAYLKKYHYSVYLEKCKKLGFPKLKFKDWYEKEGKRIQLSGRIHGCIVDLDYHDHIYLNPYNGKIVAYSASSMSDKDVYTNVKSLIAEKRPEMLESLLSLEQKDNTSLLVVETGKATGIIVNKGDEISKTILKEYSTDMYEMSNRLKQLQKVYDLKLISAWYDEFLGENVILIEESKDEKKKNKRLPHKSEYSYQLDGIKSKTKKYLGEERKQKCGMTAKLIEHMDYADVSVEFEDGTIVEHIPFEQWKKGYVDYPKAEKTAKNKKK